MDLAGDEGFTLVEMMIASAIVGLLSAIAIPSYTRFVGRARQTEAKIALSDAYTAEMSFMVENGSFSACLGVIMGVPSGRARYYTFGIHDADFLYGTCGPDGASPCNYTSWLPPADCGGISGDGNAFFLANASASGPPPPAGSDPLGPLNTWVGTNELRIYASGVISSNPPVPPEDIWVIDQNKVVLNEVSGL